MMSLQCQCSPADSDSAPVLSGDEPRPLSAWLFFFLPNAAFLVFDSFKHSPLIRSESELTPWDQLQRCGAHYNFFVFCLVCLLLCVITSNCWHEPNYVFACVSACVRALGRLSWAALSSVPHIWRNTSLQKRRKEERQTSRCEWTVFYLPVCICHEPNSCQSLKFWFEMFSSLTHMQLPPACPLCEGTPLCIPDPRSSLFLPPRLRWSLQPRLCVVWSDLLWCRAVQCVWPVVLVAVLPIIVGRRDPECDHWPLKAQCSKGISLVCHLIGKEEVVINNL